MYICKCGKVFEKKNNLGRHLTVHKNKDYIKENEGSMEIYFSEEDDDMSQSEGNNLSAENDDMSQDEENNFSAEDDHMSQDENYLSSEEDINDISEDCSFKENILVQQYGQHEKYHQIPYNLISEECHDFVQLVSVEYLIVIFLD
jgi:hypothetical protein